MRACGKLLEDYAIVPPNFHSQRSGHPHSDPFTEWMDARSIGTAAVLHVLLSRALKGFDKTSPPYVSLVVRALLGGPSAAREISNEDARARFISVSSMFFPLQLCGDGSCKTMQASFSEIFDDVCSVRHSVCNRSKQEEVLNAIEESYTMLRGPRPPPMDDLSGTDVSAGVRLSSVNHMDEICRSRMTIQPIVWIEGGAGASVTSFLARHGTILSFSASVQDSRVTLYQFSTCYEAYLAALMIGLGKEFGAADSLGVATTASGRRGIDPTVRDALERIVDAGIIAESPPDQRHSQSANQEQILHSGRLPRKERPQKSRRQSFSSPSDSDADPAEPPRLSGRAHGRHPSVRGDSGVEAHLPLGIGPLPAAPPKSGAGRQRPSQVEAFAVHPSPRLQQGRATSPGGSGRGESAAQLSKPRDDGSVRDGSAGIGNSGHQYHRDMTNDTGGQMVPPTYQRDGIGGRSSVQRSQSQPQPNNGHTLSQNCVAVFHLPREFCGPQFFTPDRILPGTYDKAWFMRGKEDTSALLIHFVDFGPARAFLGKYKADESLRPGRSYATFAREDLMTRNWKEITF